MMYYNPVLFNARMAPYANEIIGELAYTRGYAHVDVLK